MGQARVTDPAESGGASAWLRQLQGATTVEPALRLLEEQGSSDPLVAEAALARLAELCSTASAAAGREREESLKVALQLTTDHGAMERALAAISAHPRASGVHASALSLLARLATTEASKMRAVDAGALPALAKVLQRPAADKHSVWWAVVSLLSLVGDSALRSQLAVDNGLPEALRVASSRAAVTTHPTVAHGLVLAHDWLAEHSRVMMRAGTGHGNPANLGHRLLGKDASSEGPDHGSSSPAAGHTARASDLRYLPTPPPLPPLRPPPLPDSSAQPTCWAQLSTLLEVIGGAPWRL